MAKKQELKASDLTQGQGPNTCELQSLSNTEDTAESTGLSAFPSVENTGPSDSVDVQSKGSSGSCSIESPSMSNAVLSADEDRERVQENGAVRTPVEVECERYDHFETVMDAGHVQTTIELSVGEHVDTGQASLGNEADVAQEITQNELLSATNCLQCSDESDLPNAKDVTASEELLTQQAVSNTAGVEVPASVDGCLVSDDHLGQLLSCAECGSSGLYIFVINRSSYVVSSWNFPSSTCC